MLSNGSLRLFRFAGIQVSVHWTWLLVAAWQISELSGLYRSAIWMVAQYLSLFAIVLIHEFGHSLASRQVGGESRDILLWPFGGIAFVKVPPRPAAELWSIAAGPLVNVVLWPVLWLTFRALTPDGFTVLLGDFRLFLTTTPTLSDLQRFAGMMFFVNQLLLVFNLLPIYPLDGGQILRSLLWFWLGRARSLQVAAILGFVGVAGLLLRAVANRSLFSGMIALFVGQQCWNGFRQSRYLAALEKMPRHRGFACPACQQAPPGGPLWRCAACGNGFDPFSTGGLCPHCATPQTTTICAFCHASHPLARWDRGGGAARAVPPVIDV